jgi:hypothetical protein
MNKCQETLTYVAIVAMFYLRKKLRFLVGILNLLYVTFTVHDAEK